MNGWSNWATWNVVLWIDNDEDFYNARRRANLTTAARVETFVRLIMPKGTPDMKSASELNEVDWEEVCNSWQEE